MRRRLALYQAVDNGAADRVCQRCDGGFEVWGGVEMVKGRLVIYYFMGGLNDDMRMLSISRSMETATKPILLTEKPAFP